jgi:hypothetical protein
MKTDWSKVKEMAEALKSFCTLLLYIGITFFFLFAVWPKIKDFEVNKFSIAGIELSPKQKEAIKNIDNVKNIVTGSGKDTGKISFTLQSAAKLIDTTINQNDQSWVYIGQIINDKLTNSHFEITKIPKKGDIITARDAVYKRKELPLELITGEWKLGDIRGAVTDKESVKVIKVVTIQDGNYWACVQ